MVDLVRDLEVGRPRNDVPPAAVLEKLDFPLPSRGKLPQAPFSSCQSSYWIGVSSARAHSRNRSIKGSNRERFSRSERLVTVILRF
jgi:hypothetical protein